MKGYNTQAVSHPFEEDLSQVVNDYNVTKSKAQLPFIIEDDGFVYVAAHGQSNMGGQNPYTNPDGYIENFPFLSDSLQVADNSGAWVPFTTFGFPFLAKQYQFSLMVCYHFIQKYGIKIRLFQRTFGGSAIGNWQPPSGVNWVTIESQYALLPDYKPASLVMWSQGESNNTNDYATYAPLFYNWINSAIAAGYINSDYNLVLNEINIQTSPVTINTALAQIGAENANYNYVRTDGITQMDGLHFEPNPMGIVELSRRYVEKFEGLIFGFDKAPYLNRPTAPTPTIATINADSVDITWTASTATEVGATIKSYRLTRGVTGTRFYKDVGTTLSATIPFTVASGETEQFSVFGKDSNGNYTPNKELVIVSATRP